MKAFPVLALALFLAVACSGDGGERNASGRAGMMLASAEPPNVVVVTTDDLNEEVYAGSGRLRSMLEPEGTTFENAYVTNPLCCPSRATFLRGQYDHNTKVLSNVYPSGGNKRFEEVGADNATLPTRMQRYGYETAFFGKYLNGKGGEYSPPGWDRYMQAGWFDTYVDFGRTYEYPSTAWRDDLVGYKAARWVRDHGTAPFFVWASFQAPHSEVEVVDGKVTGAGYKPPARHLNTRTDALPEKPSRPEDVSDKPAWVKENAAHSEANPPTLADDYRRQLESMEGVADNLGKILAALEETGELSNTYVLFTSDNGYQMGEHGIRPSKTAPYEESIGVPMVVRGPGVPRGATRPELVLNNDISPTVLRWAGGTPHDFADGRSFAPLAEGRNVPWRERFLVHHHHTDESQFGNPTPPTYRGVVTERWKYLRYSTGERELYDLDADPYELENLVGTMPDKEAELGRRIDALKGCAGDTCRAAENAP